MSIEITRHGKVIAIVYPPAPEPEPGSILGAGVGLSRFGPGYDPHKPAIPYEDWEMHKDSPEEE